MNHTSSTSIIDILTARGFSPATQNEHSREVLYHCPLPDHDDRHPSFSVNTEKNLWKCFGCDRGGDAAELIRLLDQADEEAGGPILCTGQITTTSQSPQEPVQGGPVFDLGPLDPTMAPPATKPGCTLEDVAGAKGLPLEHLRAFGWATIPEYMGGPAVRIPYHDENLEERAVRFRCALDGEHRFRWKKGAKPLLYGLARLPEAQRAGYVLMVEGETDTVTLWHHRLPAVGVPGASTWKDSWAGKLSKIKTIYLVVEPDMGGERLFQDLSDSSLRDRLRIIRMPPETKDMNALHLSDPASFRARVETLMKDALDLYELDRQMNADELARAEGLCQDLVSQKDILTSFAETVKQLGVAGEERAVKLLYLVLSSRLLAKPVPVVMKGVSSSGKSFLVERVLRFFPESAYYALSAASEHALIRTKESFKHRFIVIYEADGMSGDFFQYILRSLLSEGHIRYETLVETREGWETMRFEKEGPTGLILTTTRVTLHPENETRMFSIPTDDTPEQTGRVFAAIAAQEDRDASADEDLLAHWAALQTVLEAGPRKVHIPYASFLAQGVDSNAPRMRRDFTSVLTLIRAHALLHQRHRTQDAMGRIVAAPEDYEQIYHLVADLVREGVQAGIPDNVRQLVLAVKSLTPDPHSEATVPRLADKLGVDQTTVRRRAAQALQRGLLINKAEKAKAYRLILGDDMPEDREILPPPWQLRIWMESGEDE